MLNENVSVKEISYCCSTAPHREMNPQLKNFAITHNSYRKSQNFQIS